MSYTVSLSSIRGIMVVQVTQEEIQKVGIVLLDTQVSLSERFRALFTLMNIGSDEAVEAICSGFVDTSELLKHELAFCLGQMQNKSALPKLTEVLEDVDQPVIVRHEAGEAIGAFGLMESLPLLNKYLDHSEQVLKETCQLAVERIKTVNSDCIDNCSQFSSVDPAPAFNKGKSVKELSEILLNPEQTLFDRYRAMFSLRNMATPEAIDVLVQGLSCSSSALFRHEVAYVLGQMADTHAVAGLAAKLKDLSDDPMVRHEVAEAIGAIDDPKCKEILAVHLQDQDLMVKQSCEIALDMNEHESEGHFQYADTLEKIRSAS